MNESLSRLVVTVRRAVVAGILFAAVWFAVAAIFVTIALVWFNLHTPKSP